MRKLIHILSIIVMLCGFATQTRAEQRAEPKTDTQNTRPNDNPALRDDSTLIYSVVLIKTLHADTPLLICYDDGYRSCHRDSSIDDCLSELRSKEPFVEDTLEEQRSVVSDNESFQKYAAAYTKGMLLVRSYYSPSKAEIRQCMAKNPFDIYASEKKINSVNPSLLTSHKFDKKY